MSLRGGLRRDSVEIPTKQSPHYNGNWFALLRLRVSIRHFLATQPSAQHDGLEKIIVLASTELLSNQFPHQPKHLSRFGMAVCFQLRIQQPPVGGHLELTAIRRHERYRFDHMLVMFQQLIHQAHGPTGVMSNRTVYDLNFQHPSSYGIQQLAGESIKSMSFRAHELLDSKFWKIISLRHFLQKRPHRFVRRIRFDLLRRPHLS